MKTRISLCLAIFGLVAANQISLGMAAPVPKVGTACPQYRAEANNQNTYFLCDKKGSRLVWTKVSKSVFDKYGPNAPKSDGFSAQQFVTQPCNKIDEETTKSFWIFICRQGTAADLKAGPHWAIKKMVANSTAPIPIKLPVSAVPGSLTFDTLNNDPDAVYTSAYNQVQNLIANSSSASAFTKVYTGPNTPNVLSQGSWTDAYNYPLKMFNGFTLPNDIQAVVYNFSDVDWATKQLDSLPQTPPHFDELPKAKCSSPTNCGAGNQGFVSFKGNTRYSIGHYSLAENALQDPYFTSGGIAIHELTHAIQGTQFFNGSQSNDGNFDLTNLVPCWLIEGQANYNAIAAPYKSFSDYKTQMQKMYQGQATTFLKDSSPAHINTLFQNSLPTPQCHDAIDRLGPNNPYRLGYSVGMFAVQALTAVGGIQSVLALSTKMAQGFTFPEAFKAVYNYDWDKASLIISTLISKQTSNFNLGYPPGPTINLDGSSS